MTLPGDDIVGYRVHLLWPQESVSSVPSEPYQVDFKTKQEADSYKREKQGEGWIANTSPVYLAPQVRGKMRKMKQGRTAPPKFNQNWTLHTDPPKGGG